MKRVLIILNTPIDSFYGASKSFRAHYELLQEKYDLQVVSQVSSKKTLGIDYNMGALFIIRNALGYTFTLNENINTIIKFLLGILYLPILLLKARNVEIIHLNSITLLLYAPIIKIIYRHMKIVCHVREVRCRHDFLTAQCLKYVDTIICIDDAVKSYLSVSSSSTHSVTVQNPVIIRKTNHMFNFNDKNIVNIAVIGRLAEEKRTLNVLNYLSSHDFTSRYPISVYVVGGPGADKKYFAKCQKIMQGMERVHYIGEIRDLENTNFYEQIDCLLRFDNHDSVGRTILEALNYNVDIYTENALPDHFVKYWADKSASRFYSLENNNIFQFRKKRKLARLDKELAVSSSNNLYVKRFCEEIYV